MLSLYPDASPASVVDALTDCRRRLTNVAGAGGRPVERLNGWREWASRSATEFRFQLDALTVKERVLGNRHDLLQSLDPAAYGDKLAALIDGEIDHRLTELGRIIEVLMKDVVAWGSGNDVALVVDTNILLAFGERILTVDWESKARLPASGRLVLVVAIQVVEELDTLKDRGDKDVKVRARHALHFLRRIFPNGRQDFVPHEYLNGQTRRLAVRLLIDDLDRVPLPRGDADLLNRSLALKPYTANTVMVSNDFSMQFRAESLGLDIAFLQGKDVPAAPAARAETRM